MPMTIRDETRGTTIRSVPTTYNTQNINDGEELHRDLDERRKLLATPAKANGKGYFWNMYPHLLPADIEDDDQDNAVVEESTNKKCKNRIFGSERQRGFRRRLFLFLTDPSSSWSSAVFFFILILAITVSSVITILQTMPSFQYIPTECKFCNDNDSDDIDAVLDDQTPLYDESLSSFDHKNNLPLLPCECPPRSFPYLERIVNYILIFFAFEWTLRVLCYVPAHPRPNIAGTIGDWLRFLVSSTTWIDALAIWPYFIERLHLPGLVSLRLLRLFRVFRLLRLGSYSSMFVSLTTVLYKSIQFLKLLVVILFFGAAIFGSLVFWLEQGEWKYWEPTRNFQYVRTSIDGTEEISPFTSIPVAFWWFVVTATTVGYGDYYPTSTAGMWVGTCAMLVGVLVIAFPVSVFSDLWSEELKQVQGMESLFRDDSGKVDADDTEDDRIDRSNHHPYDTFNDQLDRNSFQGNDEIRLSKRKSSSMKVVMEREDLNDIMSSIYTIQKEQRHIQKLLKKYYSQDEIDQ